MSQEHTIPTGFYEGTLRNGIPYTLVLEENHPLCSILLQVKEGSMSDYGKTIGQTHLLEHLFFSGHFSTSGSKRNRYLEEHGCAFNANVYRGRSTYWIEGRRGKFEASCALLQDAIESPTWDETILKTERDMVVEEHQLYEHDYALRLNDIYEAAHCTGAFQIPAWGKSGNIELPVNAVEIYRRMHEVHWHETPRHVFVAGGGNPSKIIALLEQYFGTSSYAPHYAEYEYAWETQCVTNTQQSLGNGGMEESHLGFSIPLMSPIDADVQEVLLLALGRLDSSIVNDRLRSEGIGYDFTANIYAYPRINYFWFQATVPSHLENPLYNIVSNTFNELREKKLFVEESTLRAAHEKHLVNITRSFLNPLDMVTDLSYEAYVTGRIEHPSDRVSKMEQQSVSKVNAESVQSLLKDGWHSIIIRS